MNTRYSPFMNGILRDDELLRRIVADGPESWASSAEIREATPEQLAGSLPVKSPAMLALLRGALLYAVDDIHAAHAFFQDDPGDLGSYLHGMMHRREGDFDNARYWFRRTGRLPIAAKLHEAAYAHSPTMGRQSTWDAYLLTGLCEQAHHGAEELVKECRALLRVEFEGVLDYCWRQAVG